MSDASTVVSLAPAIGALQPLVSAAVTGLVLGVGALMFAMFQKWTGAAVPADLQSTLEQAADKIVNAAVASAENNLATGSFSVGSPFIADLAGELAANAPAIVAKLGLTPAAIEAEIVAAIGRAQKAMTSVAPAAAKS